MCFIIIRWFLKFTLEVLDVVVLPLLAQYQLAAAEPLVESDEMR